METSTGLRRASLVTVIKYGTSLLAFDSDGQAYVGTAFNTYRLRLDGDERHGDGAVEEIRWRPLADAVPIPIYAPDTPPVPG